MGNIAKTMPSHDAPKIRKSGAETNNKAGMCLLGAEGEVFCKGANISSALFVVVDFIHKCINQF